LGIFTTGVCDEIGGSLFAPGHYATAGSMASLLYANCKTYGGEQTHEEELFCWTSAIYLSNKASLSREVVAVD
jgi:hypothetical protein